MQPLPPVEWRTVVTHPERYEVSNDGRVRVKSRVITRGFVTMTLEPNVLAMSTGGRTHTYRRVMLMGPKMHVRIHHLVAEAFIGPRAGRLVLHLDDDGTNNRLENLRYGDREENEMDRHVALVADGLEQAPF